MKTLEDIQQEERFRSIKKDLLIDLMLIKRRYKKFQSTPYLGKFDFLKTNCVKFVEKVEDFLTQAGEITMSEGDSKQLDDHKEFLFRALYL